ncbi:hypothetical protein B6D60_08290 [candidate division KSB1 bacterium 4484_87]|nr:MAG: hypothetical protein B6D60_08290 [candidate division KSB1 bacterium 4484_87]
MPRSSQEEEILAVKQSSEELIHELRDQIRKMEAMQKEQQTAIRTLENKLAHFSELKKFSPDKLRQELIEGIRMLGERVTQAVREIDRRHENFSAEIARKFEEIQEKIKHIPEDVESPKETDSVQIKENKLLEEDDFEIVPRDAIQRLIDLSRQQASAVKEIIAEQKQKVESLEEKIASLDTIQEESSSKKSSSISIVLSLIALLAAIISLVYQLF